MPVLIDPEDLLMIAVLFGLLLWAAFELTGCSRGPRAFLKVAAATNLRYTYSSRMN